MKKLIQIRPLLAGLAAAFTIGTAHAQFAPLLLNPNSYTFDVVVESNYVNKASDVLVNVTMDSGPTTNTDGMLQNNTWYEIGLDLASNITGLPHAGSLVTNETEPNHYYQLAASWSSDNVVFIGDYSTNALGVAPGYTNGTFTPVTPAAYSALSFLTAAGNGPVLMTVDVHHADGTDDHSTMQSPDWFAGGPTNTATGVTNGTAILAFSALGRLSITGGFGNVGASNQCELWSVDVPLGDTTSPVTSIVLGYISGGRCCNFAVSGSTGAGFSPIAVTQSSYNADAVVEAGAGFSLATLPFTATMDDATNILSIADAGGGNTWFEVGYDPIGVTNGFPIHGSTFTSSSSAAVYTMAPSYTAPNAILIDTNHQTANLQPQTPTAAAALSFLVSGANIGTGGTMADLAIIQHADGVNETNFVYVLDWFNDAATNAWSANGRVDFSNGREIQNSDGPNPAGAKTNPNLFDSLMYLSDTTSPITNIILKYNNPDNIAGANWDSYIFAVSASPTITPLPPTVLQAVESAQVGSSATLSVPALGVAATYQWSSNGTVIAGATGASYNTPATLAAGNYSYSVAVTTSTGTTTVPVELAVSAGSLFANASAWTLDNNGVDKPSGTGFTTFPFVANNVLQVTDGNIDEAAACWYNALVNVNGFVATFSFQISPANSGSNEADGAAFILQNDPRGLGAIGQNGNDKGDSGITPSVEIDFEIYGPNTIGFSLQTDGAIETAGASITNSAVDIASGHPINVGVYYDFDSSAPASSTMTISLYDTVTEGTFSTNMVVGDITSTLGTNTAYVGFTGGTGGAGATELFSNFVYEPFNTAPTPNAIAASVNPAVASAVAGTPITFTASGLGTGATYQWASNGTAITGATSATYTTPANQTPGIYPLSVTVTTSLGSSNVPAAYAVSASYEPLNDPANWKINSSGTFTVAPYVATNILQTTDDLGDQAMSAWYNFQEPVNGFVATFSYTDVTGGTTGGGADGFSLCLQNDSRGLTALGADGGSIGVSGVSPSAEWDFDLYPNNSPEGAGDNNEGGISYQVNGGSPQPDYPAGPVAIAGGHTIDVGIYYNYAQGTATEYLYDTVTKSTFTTNIVVGDLTTSVGTLAYVGFTAGTGGAESTQVISNFVFQPNIASTSIAIPPTNVSVSVGQPATFTVGAEGGPPFTYQWQFNGANIAGATDSAFTLSSPQLSNAGTYSAVVTSVTLATNVSASATLSVSPSVTATISPAAVSIYSGLSSTFTAHAYGSLPLTYQWYDNGTPIAGATTSTYTTPSTLVAGSNTISVAVSNSTSFLTPTVGLSIVTPTVFAQAALQFHPLSFWPLDESSGLTAYDFVGGNNGTYVGFPSASPGNAGPPEPGFGTPDYSAFFDGNSGWIDIPLNNLNLTNSMTMFAWIQPTANLGSKFMTFFGHSDNSYRMDYDATAATPQAHFADAPAGDATGGPSLSDGNWHMVAGVYDESTGNRTLYVDGIFAAVSNSTNTPPGSPLDVVLGGDPEYLPASGNNRLFIGFIADAAIYSSALTSNQIEQIYVSAGVAPVSLLPTNQIYADQGGSVSLTASTNGSPPLNLQWYVNNNATIVPIAGQTNITLTLNNVSASQNGYNYFLVASNAYGSSSNTAEQAAAELIVESGPPNIVSDISPLTAYTTAGGTVDFSVTAYGTAPIAYQWYVDGSAVAGATTSAYVYTATSASNTVYVEVSNGSGSTASSTATITTLAGSTIFLGSGSGWTINKSGTFTTGASIANNTFTGTDNADGEACSAWWNQEQPINGFAASFVYQDVTSGGADGTTFTLQTMGLTALGGGGGELGIAGVTNSVSWEINLYNNNGVGDTGISYDVNGAIGPTAVPSPIFASNAGPWPADPINVSINYNQSTGTAVWTLTDTVSGAVFTTNINTGDITKILGSTTAYVGFTSADGGVASTQTISEFVFNPTSNVTPPPPQGPTLAITSTGNKTYSISWTPSSTTTYVLQQSATVTGTWSNVSTTPTLSGGVDTITVTNSANAQFYRLIAP